MKKIFLLLVSVFVFVYSYGQEPVSKDLSFLKAYKTVDMDFNFSMLSINGAKFEDYATFYNQKHKDSIDFKTTVVPELIARFVKAFNENNNVYTNYLTQKTDDRNKIKVDVHFTEVNKYGDIYGTAFIYEKATSLLLATLEFKGLGSTDSKIEDASKKISSFFKKKETIDIDAKMPTAMYNAGAYVGRKIGNVSQNVIQSLTK